MKPAVFISKVNNKLRNIFFLFYFQIGESKVECNICGWKGVSFLSSKWHKHIFCPRCSSGVRHRLFWALVSHLEDFSIDKVFKNKKILHFAPEKIIRRKLDRLTDSYKTSDFLAEEEYDYGDIDYNLDISNMPDIESDSIDTLVAFDVLEHVFDDKAAYREIYRVLKKGGHCFLSVPQKDHLAKTFEDNSITDPRKREEIFGQSDHVRIYGDDFDDLLAESGLHVTVVNEQNFDQETVEKHVLFPPELSTLPLATNYRRIYIGRK